jgi:hypothetical protein
MTTSKISLGWLLASLALAGCAGDTPEAQAPVPDASKPAGASPPPPDITGASAEGVVERRTGDGSPATHLLRGDHGEVLYLLQNGAPGARPVLALGPHEGQRVNVTGSVVGRAGGVPILSVASLVVLRGGDFDKVIAVIGQFRCPGVAFAEGDGYRLDALHGTGEDRFPVHVQAGGRAYTVWIRRHPELSAGYAVEEVLRNEGKVLVPACPGAAGAPL